MAQPKHAVQTLKLRTSNQRTSDKFKMIQLRQNKAGIKRYVTLHCAIFWLYFAATATRRQSNRS